MPRPRIARRAGRRADRHPGPGRPPVTQRARGGLPRAAASRQLVQLHAPVLLTTRGGRVRRDRLWGTAAFSDHPVGRHSLTREVGADRARPRLGQPYVRRGRARVIRVTRDFYPDVRVRVERLRYDVQDGERLGLERRLAGLEDDAAQDDGRALRGEQDRAADRVHPSAGCRSRAFVLRIVHTVSVGVLEALAADVVHFHSRGCVGAFVDAVRHTVLIRVERTAGRVDHRTDGRVRALVDAIRHAIAIGIDGAPLRVHVGPRRRVRALVDAVEHTVVIGVGGTARGVYARDRGRTGTAVDPVVHAIVVGVGGAAARVDRGAQGRAGTGILLVGHAIVVGVEEGAA